MSKFIQFIKESFINKPDLVSEETVKQAKALNRKIADATINGEENWHLCWTKDSIKCETSGDKNV